MSISKDKFLKNIDLKNAKVTYNDFDIDPNLSFENQKWSLKEDIMQIEVGERLVIDIGWYPEFNQKGFFKIKLIKDTDWGSPLIIQKCKNNIGLLTKHLQAMIDFAHEKNKYNSGRSVVQPLI